MNLPRTTSLLAASAAFALLLGTAWVVRLQARGRVSDFAAFYAAGRLIGTGQLYDAPRFQRVEKESTGQSSPAHGFVRPPFHALFFWPLSRIPYEIAGIAWSVVTGLALVGFAFFWPTLDLTRRSVLTCVSLPAAIGLANGQDSALVLLTVTLAATLHRGNSPFTAGIVFSLCAAKAHLFLLLPLLIIRRRDYRFGGGLLTGGILLAVVSTIAEGPQWPARMWRAATNPAFTSAPGLMPNLAGVLDGVPSAGWICVFVAAGLATILWRTLPRAPFHTALAGAIAASLPLAPHSYLPDCVLLLPAICEAIRHQNPHLKFAGYLLATPLPFVAIFLDKPYSSITTLAILLFASLPGRSLSTESWPQARQRPFC